ncbi:FAD-binding protein [Candidatus Dependentiae bacterium]|nr:FAD-binding protein [Candidatus Dependentiae bacterium]
MFFRRFILNVFVIAHISFNIFSVVINDSSLLNPIDVKSIATPKTIDELQTIVIDANKNKNSISICGMHFSQGGHCATQNGIVINMKELNKIIHIDQEKKEVTVQTGITWGQLQKHLHSYGLAISCMQSYNDFSVGGSLSVNCHGQDIHYPLISTTVKEIKLIMADGSMLTANKNLNSEIFESAIGGYGLIGIIHEVRIQLSNNNLLRKKALEIPTESYPAYFNSHVKNNPAIALHSARLTISEKNLFKNVLIVDYYNTEQTVFSDDMPNHIKQKVINKLFITTQSKPSPLRDLRPYFERNLFEKESEMSRNAAMGSTISGLLSPSSKTTYTLQEYFIPLENFNKFQNELKKYITDSALNVLNITIRYVPKSTDSLLNYTQKDSFGFVLFVNHDTQQNTLDDMKKTTQQLISCALNLGGTYYLPYQLYATEEQLKCAYPQFDKFAQLKNKVDPNHLFTNSFWQKYGKTY